MKVLRPVLERIARHARRSSPAECCGILLSRPDEPAIVTEAIEAQNAETQRPHDRYVLGHRAHIRAVAREAGGEARIVGYYHSHPVGDAVPSPWDVGQAVEGAVYLITALGDGRIQHAAWRLQDGQMVRQSMEEIDE